MGLLGNIVNNTTDIDDEVIISSMLVSAAGAANAYLNATITSATPELKAMYSASLTQVIGGHSTLSELAIKRGWENPYTPPTQQLSEAYTKARSKIAKDE